MPGFAVRACAKRVWAAPSIAVSVPAGLKFRISRDIRTD
jgi:hypothetical protein